MQTGSLVTPANGKWNVTQHALVHNAAEAEASTVFLSLLFFL